MKLFLTIVLMLLSTQLGYCGGISITEPMDNTNWMHVTLAFTETTPNHIEVRYGPPGYIVIPTMNFWWEKNLIDPDPSFELASWINWPIGNPERVHCFAIPEWNGGVDELSASIGVFQPGGDYGIGTRTVTYVSTLGTRISNESVFTIPEPGTWIIVINLLLILWGISIFRRANSSKEK